MEIGSHIDKHKGISFSKVNSVKDTYYSEESKMKILKEGKNLIVILCGTFIFTECECKTF